MSRVADGNEDAVEALYEKRMQRKKKKLQEKENEEEEVEADPVDALPVKTLDGKLYYRKCSKFDLILLFEFILFYLFRAKTL